MKKSDFAVGQTVYLMLIENSNAYRNVLRGCKHDNRELKLSDIIIETKIDKVGKRFISVANGIKFDITNDFRQNTNFSAEYMLFLSKDDIKENFYGNKLHRIISGRFSTFGNTPFTISQLSKVAEILDIDIGDIMKDFDNT